MKSNTEYKRMCNALCLVERGFEAEIDILFGRMQNSIKFMSKVRPKLPMSSRERCQRK